MKLRPEVVKFANEMETVLRENDHKIGWDDCDFAWLFDCLKQEVAELATVLYLAGADDGNILEERYLAGIKKECADVANFCMMISDNIGDV